MIHLNNREFMDQFNSGKLKQYTYKLKNNDIEVRNLDTHIAKLFHYQNSSEAKNDFKTLKEYYKIRKGKR